MNGGQVAGVVLPIAVLFCFVGLGGFGDARGAGSAWVMLGLRVGALVSAPGSWVPELPLVSL